MPFNPRLQYQQKVDPLPPPPHPLTDWRPVQDEIPVQRPWAAQAALVACVIAFTPQVNPPADARAWAPSYPDRIDAATSVQPASQQAFAYTSSLPNYAIPDRSWAGVWPDRIDRPQLLAAQRPFYASTDFATFPVPVPDLAWLGHWPDQLLPKAPPPQYADLVVGPWLPNLAVPDLSWGPIYPDFARKTQLHPATPAWVAFIDIPPLPVPSLAWLGVWPDRIVRFTLPTSAQQALAWGAGLPAFPVPDHSWGPAYPDKVWPRLSLATPLQQALAYAVTLGELPVPDLGWGPCYPDIIWPQASLLVAAQRALAFDPFPIVQPVPDLSWLNVYPDQFLIPARLLTAAQLAWTSTTEVFTGPPAPELSWSPTYPPWIAPLRGLAVPFQPVTFAYHPTPIPPIPVPELPGWLSIYPNWIDPKVSLRAALQLPYTGTPLSVLTPAVPGVISWTPNTPPFLRRALASLPKWEWALGEPPIAEFNSWQGSYPAYIVRAVPPLWIVVSQPSGFAPSSGGTFIPALLRTCRVQAESRRVLVPWEPWPDPLAREDSDVGEPE